MTSVVSTTSGTTQSGLDGLEQVLGTGVSKVSMLIKSSVLAESFPGKTLEEFLTQHHSEVETNVDNTERLRKPLSVGSFESFR